MSDSEFYRSLLRAYIDSANDGIFVLCDEMKFHVANPVFESWLGATEASLTEHNRRRPIIDFMGQDESRKLFLEKFSLLLSGHPVRFECCIHPEGGVERWLDISLNKVNLEAGDLFIGIARDITESMISQQIIWQQANFDNLTGLANRDMFKDRLEQEIRNSHHNRLPLALLLLDLDRFKEINETMGHDVGDILLREVAERLKICAHDIGLVARMGGDEFAIMVKELRDTESVNRLAKDILQMISKPFRFGEQDIYISSSIGITYYPEDASSFEALLKNADQAMYAAKQEGRNRIGYFAPYMQEAAQKRMRVSNDLRASIGLEESFQLYYQPIVELSSGKICKAEALLRWKHPLRGITAPAEFIPIAEETGMILEIGEWVFREAVAQALQWQSELHPAFQISINVSPVQFHNSLKIVEWLAYMRQRSLPCAGLVMEITESLLLENNETVMQQLHAFQHAGIEISLDDFGTGYSSLSYLKKFNINNIKIDQSFVRNLAPDSDDMVLCEAMIAMAHKLGIKVIAEGIETELQRELLSQAGCDFGQGYLFARPLPAAEFSRLPMQFCSK